MRKTSSNFSVVTGLVFFFIVTIRAEENVLVMLGDSTTLCANNKPGFKITDLVQAYLTDKKTNVNVINAGVGGNTAKQGYARLEKDVIARKPDFVTISFGLNDTGNSTPEDYQECMEKIIEDIQSKTQAKIMLITSNPFNNARHFWKDKFKEGLDEYMDSKICGATRKLAKKYDLPLCDLHKEFKNLFKKKKTLIDTYLMADGVHLTDEGNKAAAEFIAPMIAIMVKPEKKTK